MIIESPEVKHLVNDYDITFESGMMMPFTVDLSAGDTLTFTDKSILLHLSAKPSPSNPKQTLPAESVTIFLSHVVAIQHREREVVQLSPDQQFEWQKTLQELTSNTVN